MGRILYRVGLLLVGGYFYSRGNSLWVLCAIALGWSFLQQQIAAIVGILGNPNYNYSEIRTLSQAFKEKRDRLLEAEGYRSHGLTDDEERWRYPDIGHRYENTCGEVVFQNMNANRGTRWDARWFSDYYEEEP